MNALYAPKLRIAATSLKLATTHFKRHAQAGMVMVNVPTAGVDKPRALRWPQGIKLRSARAGSLRSGVLHDGEGRPTWRHERCAATWIRSVRGPYCRLWVGHSNATRSRKPPGARPHGR